MPADARRDDRPAARRPDSTRPSGRRNRREQSESGAPGLLRRAGSTEATRSRCFVRRVGSKWSISRFKMRLNESSFLGMSTCHGPRQPPLVLPTS
jgi:hypothetical protein